jgi:hypothetical protein
VVAATVVVAAAVRTVDAKTDSTNRPHDNKRVAGFFLSRCERRRRIVAGYREDQLTIEEHR